MQLKEEAEFLTLNRITSNKKKKEPKYKKK